MNFSEKLKAKRKEFGMSQEQLAEKIGVSRQAITKWETDAGMPDIGNILSIASLFNTSVDEMLSSEKQLKNDNGFFYESTTEYDIDSKKHYDIKIGGAYEIIMDTNDGEKLRIKLGSNIIPELEKLLKVKIDEGKNNVDVDLRRSTELTEAQMKEGLRVFVSIPKKYIKGVELATRASILRLSGIEAKNIELDGRVSQIYVNEVKGFVELNSAVDSTIVCENLSGSIGVNQISCTSVLHIPRGTQYKVKKKGASNRCSYTVDGKAAQPPDYPEAEDIIRLTGLNSELVINECSNILEVRS